jgi:hypothetical protein
MGLRGFNFAQADFGDWIGVSQSYLSAVERGRCEVGRKSRSLSSENLVDRWNGYSGARTKPV